MDYLELNVTVCAPQAQEVPRLSEALALELQHFLGTELSELRNSQKMWRAHRKCSGREFCGRGVHGPSGTCLEYILYIYIYLLYICLYRDKIGTIQISLAWPLCAGMTRTNREVYQVFKNIYIYIYVFFV